jgi:hypothetical protein
MTQLLFCCAACIVATLGVAVREQTDTVPFYLVAAAERPFAEFMMLVAHASVRAGIESDFANSRIRMPQKLQATLKPQ